MRSTVQTGQQLGLSSKNIRRGPVLCHARRVGEASNKTATTQRLSDKDPESANDTYRGLWMTCLRTGVLVSLLFDVGF